MFLSKRKTLRCGSTFDLIVIAGGSRALDYAECAAGEGKKVLILSEHDFLATDLHSALAVPTIPSLTKYENEQRLLQLSCKIIYKAYPIDLKYSDCDYYPLQLSFAARGGIYNVKAHQIFDHSFSAITERILSEEVHKELNRHGVNQLDFYYGLANKKISCGLIIKSNAEAFENFLNSESVKIFLRNESLDIKFYPSPYHKDYQQIVLNFDIPADPSETKAYLFDKIKTLFKLDTDQVMSFADLALYPALYSESAKTDQDLSAKQLWQITAGQKTVLRCRPKNTKYSLVRHYPAHSSFTCDLLILGCGSSGSTAALSAAEEGLNVIVADMNSEAGGTATAGAVHSYWYGKQTPYGKCFSQALRKYEDVFRPEYGPCIWSEYDQWNPRLKAAFLESEFQKKDVHFFKNTLCYAVKLEGRKISGLYLANAGGPFFVEADVILDASGDAEIPYLCGFPVIYGSEKDRMSMWANLARYHEPGITEGGLFSSSCLLSSAEDYSRFIILNRKRGIESHHGIPFDFASYAAPRESRHIIGDYTIGLDDICLHKDYKDRLIKVWSNYDPKGKSQSDLLYFGFLPSQYEANVPYSSCTIPQVDNLLVGGKAISQSHDAMPLIRMQRDMETLGFALGIAAKFAYNSKGVRAFSIRQLQKKLKNYGITESLPVVKEQTCGVGREKLIRTKTLKEVIKNLKGDEALETLEMNMLEKDPSSSAIAKVLLSPKNMVVPFLKEAYEESKNKKQSLLLAKLLLWHGSTHAFDKIVCEIRTTYDHHKIPERKGSLKFVQTYPDHAVMAEVSYSVALLSRAGYDKIPQIISLFRLIVQVLQENERNYFSQRKCIFGHIDSMLYVIMRLPDPGFQEILFNLLKFPEFENTVLYEQDFSDLSIIKERIAYLKLLIGEALARTGAEEGFSILLEYARFDIRETLSRSAADLRTELLPRKGKLQPYRKIIY